MTGVWLLVWQLWKLVRGKAGSAVLYGWGMCLHYGRSLCCHWGREGRRADPKW